MTPQFPQKQSRTERLHLLKEALVPNPEIVEAELDALFQSCGKPLILGRVEPGPEFSQSAGHQVSPIIVYDAGEKQFAAEPRASVDRMRPFKVTAPMISSGLLADLLEVNHIVKKLGIVLTKEQAVAFKNDHLTTVQEFLALGKWRSPTNVSSKFQAVPTGKDVDWRFDVRAGVRVLLEVKFRRADWRRNHPETQHFDIQHLFAKIEKKFPDDRAGFLRVAHVVLIRPIDNDVACAAEEWCKKPVVDAVILESLDQSGEHLKVVGKKAKFVWNQIIDRRAFPRPAITPMIFKRPGSP